MVHYSKVVSGIVTFVDRDMVQRMAGSWKAWAVGGIVALAARKAPEVFDRLRSDRIVQAMGLIDGEMVDVEAIYAELLKQAQKASATVEVPMIGAVTYSAKDVEELYRCIMG